MMQTLKLINGIDEGTVLVTKEMKKAQIKATRPKKI